MPSKTALVIVDVQRGMFTTPGMIPHQGQAVLANLTKLISRARVATCPVIYIKQAGAAGHPLEQGTPGHDIKDEIAPAIDDLVITKTQCGMFLGTELEDELNKRGITRLIIGGLQTEFCVDTAIRTAADRGFKVVVAADCHSTFDTPSLSARDMMKHHEAIWGQAFAKVQASTDIVFKEAANAPA